MTISLPTAAPANSARGLIAVGTVSTNGGAPETAAGMLNVDAQAGASFFQFLTQVPAQLPVLPIVIDGKAPPVPVSTSSLPVVELAAQEDGETELSELQELPGMAPPMMSLLNLPPAPAAFGILASAASSKPSAAMALPVAATATAATATHGVEVLATRQAHAVTAASSALPVEAIPAALERHAGTQSAVAPLWSATSVPQDDTGTSSLRLNGPTSQWQQPLRQALGEQLQVQLERGSEQAVIRLSPPMLGRVEISIRHEAGSLQVNITATHNEVLRQLQGIGDSLRQDLSQRQYSDVAVVVSQPTRHSDGDGRQRQGAAPDQQQPGRALADADQGNQTFAFLSDKE